MKQEKVIELAKQAGFGNYAIEAAGIFEKFAALAEQATLERAAQVCERDVARMTNDLHGTTFYIATGQCAQAIRALSKEQQ